ncbi:hypothetical protein [Halomonas sp. LBP4]|uniref:hypothetical protein n=1 Tax=Halomonas sp. LBP4 TaxID=2044917 RepID=UPI0011B5AB16|nr:hypothetical protein [Halomonas sp. LBP4]
MGMGMFVFGNLSGVQMTPSQFGQAIIEWAHQSSKSTLATIVDSPDSSLLMMKIREAPFQVELQLIALDVATYMTYASDVLRIPNQAAVELKHGMEEGLRRMRDPQGKPFDSALHEMFSISLNAYMKAVREEFKNSSTSDPLVVNPKGGLPSQVFFHITRQAYFMRNESIDPATQFLVGNIIDNLVTISMSSLKDDLGVCYK